MKEKCLALERSGRSSARLLSKVQVSTETEIIQEIIVPTSTSWRAFCMAASCLI